MNVFTRNGLLFFILIFKFCLKITISLENKTISEKSDHDNDLIWIEGLREEEIDISHRTDSLSMLILTVLLIITVLSAWLFKLKKFGWLQEAGFSLILGIIVGGIIRLSLNAMADLESDNDSAVVHLTNTNELSIAPSKLLMNISGKSYEYYLAGIALNNSKVSMPNDHDIEQIEAKSSFNPEIFFYVLLPPIVFYAGYQLQRFYFFTNLGSICVLTFIGTAISFITVGGIVYGYMILNNNQKYFTFTECLLFSAIISATDPVTILATFNELRVEHDIYALVFGESVLNDAIAIGLHKAVLTYMRYPQKNPIYFNGWSFLEALLNFVFIFIGSFFVGVSVACLTALITKLTKIGMFPLLETALILLMSYSTFLISEVANWSGIVAVLFCGISQKHYTHHNLSFASSIRIVQLLELLTFLSESFIFSYIGLSVFLSVEHKWDIPFIILVFVSLQIGRAIAVYPLCFFLNINRNPPIPIVYMHLLTWSGMRGAMAFALAIRNTSTEVRQLMLTATLSSVILSVMLQAFENKKQRPTGKIQISKEEVNEIPFENRLININNLQNVVTQTLDDKENETIDQNNTNKEETSVPSRLPYNRFVDFFHRLDKYYLLPFFTHQSQV